MPRSLPCSCALLVVLCALVGAGCGAGSGGDGTGTQRVEPEAPAAQPGQMATITVRNLPQLDNAHYELWMVAGERRHSLGQFAVDDRGRTTSTDPQDFVTDEPAPGDSPPAPPLTVPEALDAFDGWEVSIEEQAANAQQDGPVVLAGDWEGASSELAFPLELDEASGGAALGAPPGSQVPERSGVVFATPEGDRTLMLPNLADGWRWRAELVLDEDVLPIGSFTALDEPDDTRNFSPAGFQHEVPGEAFVRNLPGGREGPLDLPTLDATITILLEPTLDSLERISPAWPTIVLEGPIPADAEPGVVFNLDPPANRRLPTATVLF